MIRSTLNTTKMRQFKLYTQFFSFAKDETGGMAGMVPRVPRDHKGYRDTQEQQGCQETQEQQGCREHQVWEHEAFFFLLETNEN